ncbi:hypothetical protein AJ80_06766 [Polytolypa hystricis UAMH7299]|uniref:Ecp2 effector protein domain-containing protein n=1 Tax=Polytolypa hystricis (strain UAMH7299) TaxID=1447883 RepID=A0A2B7XUE0_POLH7|nr:hypothetical protein AJ80_06766 [Polytolypa hystricis UAMH7299]
MLSVHFLSTLLISFTTLAASQPDYIEAIRGPGIILAVPSEDLTSANPVDAVGCLNDNGRLIAAASTDRSACAIFDHADEYDTFVSGWWTKSGNCSFLDPSQEFNTDSHYGSRDNAFHCTKGVDIGDDLFIHFYTLGSWFDLPVLCNGNLNCYYDAKKIPSKGEALPIWPYRWGSQQMGITPGHTQYVWMFQKVGST